MITWNPQTPAAWASLFGFATAPLFGKGREPEGRAEHAVLLDGRRSSLTFSRGEAESLIESHRPLEWAWSANIPRSIIIDEETSRAYAVRWDQPTEIRSRELSTQNAAKQLLADLDSSAVPMLPTSVSHALDVFRSVRREVHGSGGNDLDATRAFIVVLLQAEYLRDQNQNTSQTRYLDEIVEGLGERGRFHLHPSQFSAGVRQLPLNDLSAELLREDSAYQLDPYLLIRHASGTLFQEAHVQLKETSMASPKLFLTLHQGLPKPPGKPTQDAHYTPTALARYLTEQAIKEYERLNPHATSISILDPACGSGVFLVESIRELEGGSLSADLSGVDSSPISKLMADFAVSSGGRDFEAYGGSVRINIKRGNSLGRSEWGRPDVILMNPPFRPWQRLNSKEREGVRLSMRDLYQGHADTALAFLSKAVHTINPGGVVATVLPSSFLNSEAAQNLRNVLSGPEWNVSVIGRVRGYGYFADATVEPAFIVVSRSQKGNYPPRTILADADVADVAIRKSRTIPASERGVGPGWEISPRESLDARDWTPRPVQAGELLQEFSNQESIRDASHLFNIHLGIRTGDNAAFIVTSEVVQTMPRPEREYFRPIANNIRHGRIQDSKYVFYPYKNGRLLMSNESRLESEVPVFLKKYLRPKEDQLKSRSSLRKRKWWELSEPRTGWLEFNVPKIVSMTYGKRGSFALDIDGAYAPVQGIAWLWRGHGSIRRELWLGYLALLNSPVFEAMLDYFCRRTRGGQYDLEKKFLEAVPLPDLTSIDDAILSKLASHGEQMAEGDHVSPTKLSNDAASAYGVTLERFTNCFPLTPSGRLEVEFEERVEKWKAERQRGADLAEWVMHPAYQAIVGMGDAVVPMLLQELDRSPDHWFPALNAITEANPVPKDKAGRFDDMRSAWLDWGRAKGYIS